VQSGLTVALVGLPQCLAYAMMSGLPPAYGLATAAVPGVAAAIFGKSPQIVTGPTNTTGLLILAALGPYLAPNGFLAPAHLSVLATLALMGGLIRLLVAVAGGATAVDFLPESVLVGFATGAGILIGAMQLDEALGLSAASGGNLVAVVLALAKKLAAGEHPALPSVAVTALTVAAIAVGKRYRPKWPVALLVVVAAAALVLVTGTRSLPIVGDRAAVQPGWPPGALPSFDLALWRELFAPAAAMVLIGTLELAVSARAGGARPDMAREVRAQGIANVVGAFTSALPASASLTRSALLKLGGAESRLAAGIAALAVVPLLFFAAPLVGSIPLASLAGVLIITAAGMIQVDRIKRMWAFARPTRVLLSITLTATLVLPFEWAILGGIGLGLVIELVETTRTRCEVRRVDAAGELVPLAEGERADTLVVEVSGHLFYAAISRFLREMDARVPADTKYLVIDLTHAFGMRYAALLAFEQLRRRAEARGGKLVLDGVSPAFAEMLRRGGSDLEIYEYDPVLMRSVRRALASAERAPGAPGSG
jgi:SulP family sulfate permease